MDEPSITNPTLYHNIRKHDSVEVIYGNKLVDEGILTKEQMSEMIDSVQKEMRTAQDKIDKSDKMNSTAMNKPESLQLPLQSDEKEFSFEHLKEINDAMLNYPEDFHVFRKLNKVLENVEPFENENGLVDCSSRTISFATIVQDGISIRLTGQDSERGTFSHRHAVLHDEDNGNTYTASPCTKSKSNI